MNIARTICTIRNKNVGTTVFRNFRITATNYESTQASQPKVKEEKFDFEDLKVLERTENRKAAISPFMKNVFVSIFDRELLAYPEILNKDETTDLDKRVARLEAVFSNTEKTEKDRVEALKLNQMYAAPVALTVGGLAMNTTESIRYLETISSDLKLAQQLSDHWVALEALKAGLRAEQFQQIVDDLIGGQHMVSLCVKEKLAERISQADFRTIAEMDGQEIWRISGEKVCSATSGYYLVLGSSEAGRLRAFLVHPGATGVTATEDFVTFQKTPATPLDEVTEARLAQILGTSRLHTATLCRCSLQRAMLAATEYIRERAFNGKPLSDLPTLRSRIGSTLLDIYASESGEYFTAGLLDGYLNPDAEIEVAMCRNFIATQGLSRSLDLLSIPPLENQHEFSRYFEDIRLLTLRGENQDNVNMFIALNGIHHAGKVMAEEIKQIRNPLFHPSFIVKKVFANRHQEKDDPKLNLYLAEHLHPSLRPASEQLEYSVLRMRFACETIMARHGNKVGEASTYLATGCSFGDFELVYRCGASTARLIVKETCKLIYASLQDICVPQPTEEMWSKIAKGFEEYANFPNCCGAIDGKHIRIIKPQDSGSLYYNYKHYFSIVLLAVCDVNYKFTFIDVGSYGKASDSTIYKESKLFKKLEDQSLNLPAPKAISSSSGPVNYCFVGDEAFGLAEHMLRPYSGKHLNIEKRIFNYRLSRARRHIECAFGILVNKWRILHRPLNVSIDFAEDIVKACCILHNFVRQRDGFNFHHTLTVPGLHDIDNAHVQSRRSLNTRDILKDYFISNEGAVPWQNNKI